MKLRNFQTEHNVTLGVKMAAYCVQANSGNIEWKLEPSTMFYFTGVAYPKEKRERNSCDPG